MGTVDEPRVPEMEAFAALVNAGGLPCLVLPSNALRERDDGYLEIAATGQMVDFIFNKTELDGRLRHPQHAHIRRAVLAGKLVLTPHPASYVLSSDKRAIGAMRHAAVLANQQLRSRSGEEWWADRRRWVFKPPNGLGSQGVTVGLSLTQRQLREMLDTDAKKDWQAQEFAPACLSENGVTNFDLRIWTHGTTVLGVATRHFVGNIMAFTHPRAGLRKVRLFESSDPVAADYARRVGGGGAYKETGGRDAPFVSTQMLLERQRKKAEDRKRTKGNVIHQAGILLKKRTGEVIQYLMRRKPLEKKLLGQAARLGTRLRREMLQEVKRDGLPTTMAALEEDFVTRVWTELGLPMQQLDMSFK